MKKLMTVTLAAATLLMVTGERAEADGIKTINFTDQKVKTQLLSNNYSIEGLKVGKKLSTYKNNKNYKLGKSGPGGLQTGVIDSVISKKGYFLAYADRQEDKAFNRKKITRIRLNAPAYKGKSKILLSKVRKVYGKPIYQKKVPYQGGYEHLYVYKTVTFYADQFSAKEAAIVSQANYTGKMSAKDLKIWYQWNLKNGMNKYRYTPITKQEWK